MKTLLKTGSAPRLAVLNGDTLHQVSNSVAFSAGSSGTQVLVLAGIHGNEWCGVHAINQFLDEFPERWQWTGGRLAFVLGNEEALQANVRYVGANMNRQFSDHSLPDGSAYEKSRVETLKACLSSGFDYVLDLHSTSAPTLPYVMCERPQLSEAKAFGFKRIVVGWGELGDRSTAGDTETYAVRHGAKAFTVENGQHEDPQSIRNSYQVLTQFLSRLGLTPKVPLTQEAQEIFELVSVQRLEDHSFRYTRQFKNLEQLSRGEIIGSDRSKTFTAPVNFDPVMVLPGPPEKTRVGDNLYLIARRIAA